ncbi:hypothetical protein [Kitasatospora phosalacinea]|uniref:Uncharacterized protein n=1 Tax=Kitasatospora phosalacinea TaxID=2065 RepID=A0A9W6PPI9_9ACTN|nr:hypothetical protein [Kitasatospora phosalacinea]GLW58563.1 hypothetical protein Kpho01_65740 [Kitasatospora phosalacinea]
MTVLATERLADESADAALVALRAFIAADPAAYRHEPVGAEGTATIIADLITSALHLADAVGVAGDREEFVHRAYCRYREEAAYDRLADSF